MSTVSAADIRRHFPREVVDVVLELVDRGASVRRTKAGHLNIKSSVNAQTMSVSRNSGSNRTPMHKVLSDAKRLYPDFGEPLVLTKADMQQWDKDIRDCALKAVNEFGWLFSWKRAGGRPMLALRSPDGVKTFEWTSETKPIQPNVSSIRLTIARHGKITVPDVEVPEVPRVEVPPAPHVEVPAVSETPEQIVEGATQEYELKPWLAKRFGRKGAVTERFYESQHVMERTWRDGHVDYVCSTMGCGYDSDSPNAVAKHSGRKHGPKDKPDQTFDMPATPPKFPRHVAEHEYSPHEDRLDALTRYLMEKWSGAELDTEEDFRLMAKNALTWQHEQRKAGDPGEPLTDAELVARIRGLVDQGVYARQEAQIEELRLQLEATQEDAAHCRARADELAGNLGALKDLMAGLNLESEGN